MTVHQFFCILHFESLFCFCFCFLFCFWVLWGISARNGCTKGKKSKDLMLVILVERRLFKDALITAFRFGDPHLIDNTSSVGCFVVLLKYAY